MTERDTPFVLCVENEGFEVSLEKRKVYRRLSEEAVGDDRLIRVVDESGEDYLFPAEFFVPIVIPESASSAFDEIPA